MDFLMPTLNRRPNGGRSSWNPVCDTSDWVEVLKYRSTGNMLFANELSNNLSSLSSQTKTEQRPMLEYQRSNVSKVTDDSLSQDKMESPMVVIKTPEMKSENEESLHSSRHFIENGYLKSFQVSTKNTDMLRNSTVVNAKKHVLV